MIKLMSLFIIIAFVSCAPARTPSQRVYDNYSYSREKSPRLHVRTPTYKDTYYVIKTNDSLWKISKEYGVSVKEIMKRNRIYSPGRLKVGQKIIIPRRRYTAKARFVWPVEGEIINFFGETINNSINKGLNIKANPNHKSVIAVAEGKVVFSNSLKGWGKTIILRHASSFYSIYANLNDTFVNEGNIAKKRQVIGELASSKEGDYILHFEIRNKHIPYDPLRYLN
ncbi:MAG: LysM peptidoglycan-binding domain-containing M23 family metallopeptidase [Omnitrophica bacterium]|nr:LysM peptidoglycan-binding domain-containing M23 family metallopeptidase [Candidatus Omnitrophota bacterium]